MPSSCLQCSRRILLGVSTTRLPLKQSRGLQTAQQPWAITFVHRKLSWQWQETAPRNMDIRLMSRTVATSIFSIDERDDCQKRPPWYLATDVPLSATARKCRSSLAKPLLVHNFANMSNSVQRRLYKPSMRNLLDNLKSPLSLKQEQASQTKPPLKARPLPLFRDIQVPRFGLDAEKANRSLQNARKEQARAKTAANVRRALYGNLIICASKLGAWLSSGSSSMMSEFVHSVVDCGNQALLLMGLRDSQNAADKLHPYGYGKSVYFWALVSALGTFFLGAGISMSHSVTQLMEPSLSNITNEVWAVLVMSFLVDGYVLYKTVSEIQAERPNDVSFWHHVKKIRDPATLAVLLEDGAACLGIAMAIAGIGASHLTNNPVFDGMAGVGISCLLGGIGLALVRVNHRFLIGQGVEREILDGIEKIIRSRSSIDHVSSIQSQWTGPETFSFKAEIDFDGTYLSALLMPRYQSEFEKASNNLEGELEVLLSWYAEDVIRAIEREVRHIEAMIRQKYPGAEYIELEPMSKHADRFAIDDSFEEKLLLIEKEELQRLVRVLHQKKDSKTQKPDAFPNGAADTSER
ncbi:cation efflux protein [Nitzschia inconspicua]|uniref:Cation efflux protein n=1 Tax=Nitzschia inconspicua TaxID=303405 RepID=A0A9K3LCE9_9STRA|nr:cation efflux protein [Nitzschia inconspicua]